MMRSLLAAIPLVLASGVPPDHALPLIQQREPPAFRATTVLVPLEVRVIDDSSGRAITDLSQSDFSITENGVPQAITHFERRVLQARTPEAERLTVRDSAFSGSPQDRRVFLFVLGGGGLNGPSNALMALQQFVRNDLLPQDLLAVLAYDRATDFGADHEMVARFIERYRLQHEQINAELAFASSGLAAIYGRRVLPQSVRAKVDNLFAETRVKELGTQETAAGRSVEEVLRSQVAAKQEKNFADTVQGLQDFAAKNLDANAPRTPAGRWTTLDEVAAQEFTHLSLDEFMEAAAVSLRDFNRCLAGIEYLRHFDGEKHLVFVTPRGFALPRGEDDTVLVKAANDARVAIDSFQTGGLLAQRGAEWTDQSAQTFAFKTLRSIAEGTGGVSSIAEGGAAATGRIREATQASYRFGYYSTSQRLDGGYRTIAVKVKRRNATVLYRHGYYAREEIGAFNRREFVTAQRLRAAVALGRDVDDIKVRVSAASLRGAAGHQLQVRAAIDSARLGLTPKNGGRSGEIDILIVCFDGKGAVLRETYQRAAVVLTEEAFGKALESGVPYLVRFDVDSAVRVVRLVVYDYSVDLVGSTEVRVF